MEVRLHRRNDAVGRLSAGWQRCSVLRDGWAQATNETILRAASVPVRMILGRCKDSVGNVIDPIPAQRRCYKLHTRRMIEQELGGRGNVLCRWSGVWCCSCSPTANRQRGRPARPVIDMHKTAATRSNGVSEFESWPFACVRTRLSRHGKSRWKWIND